VTGGGTPAAPRLAYADTRLGQMHLRVWPGPADARAPAVVCLHPVPYSGRYFDRFAADLAARASVVAPDLMGYGGSAPLAEPAPIAEHAAAVADALQSLGLGRYVPLGYHTGAAVAGELALARPKKVPGVVLAGYPLLPPDERAHQREALGRGVPVTEELESLRRRWRFTVQNRAAGVPAERALVHFVEELRAGDRAWFGFQSTFEYAAEERLGRLGQPALVLIVDGPLAPATRAAGGLLPGARPLELPHIGRGAFELHAEELARLTAEFIGATTPDAAD